MSRGGGSTYTSAYKIQHDLEQALYLADHLEEDAEEAEFFQNVVAPTYQEIQRRIPPLESLKKTHGLYPFRPADYAETKIGQLYNKALHPTNMDTLRDEHGHKIPLLNPQLNARDIEKEWDANDGILVVDDILTPQALQALQTIMWESTVWYQTKMPLRFGGYVGSYIDDGLHDPILLDLSMELYDFLPYIFQGHFLRYLWAYKYDSQYTGINLHADQAAVNVNIWLTPDEANLNPHSGGLVVYTAKPPADWDFAQYNTDTEFVKQQLLAPTGYANRTIPYRTNRAVIFDSALFHQTDSFEFRPGYQNRRINLTLLYGKMNAAQQKQQQQQQQQQQAKDEL